MKLPLKKISHALEYVLFVGMGVIVRKLSIEQCYRLANWIGGFIYDKLKLRRDVVEKNLQLSFPEKSSEELSQIALEAYQTQAINLLETLRLPLINTVEKAKAVVEFVASPEFEANRRSGKGCVVVSAHFGNWEIMTHCSSVFLGSLSIVTKAQSNAFVDRKMSEWRQLFGNKIIGMKQAPRECIRDLKNGRIICLLSDQSGPKDGYYRKFLNQDASVFLGGAVFALRCQVPLFITMCVRTGVGTYRMEVNEIPSHDLKSTPEDIQRLADRYITAIENVIKAYPGQWFWMHNRWKHKPPANLV
jgi:KDO2-lipid IV(A) lauroyltransferase